tara:strand:+ start:4390 stop:5997 length:1608 start_codon:yes stop_codon:yes gene_type:complete
MYDCIIIGGGHNGLVAAAYLAKAKKKVLVLEARHVLGGCASTEELWPGFKISPASYVISLLSPQIISDLKLRENGLKILRRHPSSITPTHDKKFLVLSADGYETSQSIKQFSKKDAAVYAEYESMLERVAVQIEYLLDKNPPILESNDRRLSVLGKGKNAARTLSFAKRMKRLITFEPMAAELLFGAAQPILEYHFESEPLKATLAADAIIGAYLSPSSLGSAYTLLHHVMGMAGGARGIWGYIQGGMGGLSDALEKTCLDLGVEIRRESPVTEITTDNNKDQKVFGVVVDKKYIHSRSVISGIDAKATYSLIDLPNYRNQYPSYGEAISRVDYSSASAKINLALDALPNFNADFPLSGTIHLSPDLECIEKAYTDTRSNEMAFSEWPVLEITIPSVVDDTLAPPGKHVMNIFTQYFPYRKDGLSRYAKDDKHLFFQRCMVILAQYAPNMKDIVLYHEVLTPFDLEKRYGLTGGNIMQGAMSPPHQLGSFRPVAGWSDYRTPIKGLYMCGAATHPGGGVMGICGMNAVREILRDL